jgi:hypothetical protein
MDLADLGLVVGSNDPIPQFAEYPAETKRVIVSGLTNRECVLNIQIFNRNQMKVSERKDDKLEMETQPWRTAFVCRRPAAPRLSDILSIMSPRHPRASGIRGSGSATGIRASLSQRAGRDAENEWSVEPCRRGSAGSRPTCSNRRSGPSRRRLDTPAKISTDICASSGKRIAIHQPAISHWLLSCLCLLALMLAYTAVGS